MMSGMKSVVIFAILFVAIMFVPAKSETKCAKSDNGKILITALIVESSQVNVELLNNSFMIVQHGNPVTYAILSSDQLKATLNRMGMDSKTNTLSDVHVAGNNKDTKLLSNPQLATLSGQKANFYVGTEKMLIFNNGIFAGHQEAGGIDIDMIPRILDENVIQLRLSYYLNKGRDTGSKKRVGSRESDTDYIKAPLRANETLMISYPAKEVFEPSDNMHLRKKETPKSNSRTEDKTSITMFITANCM